MTDIDDDDELTPEEEALAQRLMRLQNRLLSATDETERWEALGELVETGYVKLRMTKDASEARDENEILRIRLV